MGYAQFKPTIQAYYDFGVDTYKNSFYGANFIVDYVFNPSLAAGVGVGIGGADILYSQYNGTDSRDAATLMPLFADLKYKFNPEGVSPYLRIDAGYNVALSSNIDSPGFFALPSIGVSFPLTKGEFQIQVGYKYQRFQYKWWHMSNSSSINPFYSNSATEKTSSNEIQLSIGFSF